MSAGGTGTMMLFSEPAVVQVTVIGCKELMLPADAKELYGVVCHGKQRCQTDCIKPSNSPVWDYTTNIFTQKDSTTPLCVEVKAKTSRGDKLIGFSFINPDMWNFPGGMHLPMHSDDATDDTVVVGGSKSGALHLKLQEAKGASEVFELCEADVSLLPGERLLFNMLDVSAMAGEGCVPARVTGCGPFFITNFRLIFLRQDAESTSAGGIASSLSTLQMTMGSIRKVKTPTNHRVRIKGYDGCALNFDLPESATIEGSKANSFVSKLLTKLNRLGVSSGCFAAQYGASEALPHVSVRGAIKYDLFNDLFNRLGVSRANNWRMSDINRNYGLCSSYPEHVFVPFEVSDDTLRECAAFHSNQRLPILCWMHQTSSGFLCRSAQKLGGITQATSLADQEVMKAMANTVPSGRMLVADLRPQINARANRAKGAGPLVGSNYPYCDLKFFNLENIHAVRKSYSQLLAVCYPRDLDDSSFLEGLGASKWLLYVAMIIRTSMEVAREIVRGGGVLVHCSDGWDRTSQVVSLALLLLDSQYRTAKGFCSLVEKEWIQAGHKFATRSGMHSSSEESPIFLQWLDCVYQIMSQFPDAFEFNRDALLFLSDQIYSRRFSTFLFNSAKEHDEVTKKQGMKLDSVWSVLLDRRMNAQPFVSNPTFEPKHWAGVLNASSSQRALTLWKERYLRWAIEAGPGIFQLPRVTADVDELIMLDAEDGENDATRRATGSDVRSLGGEEDLMFDCGDVDSEAAAGDAFLPGSYDDLSADLKDLSIHQSQASSTHTSVSSFEDNRLSMERPVAAERTTSVSGMAHDWLKRGRRTSIAAENLLASGGSALESPALTDRANTQTPVTAIDRRHWKHDHEAKTCALCHARFTMTRRRHHCRFCGMIFCANCTPFKVQSEGGPLRSCRQCRAKAAQ